MQTSMNLKCTTKQKSCFLQHFAYLVGQGENEVELVFVRISKGSEEGCVAASLIPFHNTAARSPG